MQVAVELWNCIAESFGERKHDEIRHGYSSFNIPPIPEVRVDC